MRIKPGARKEFPLPLLTVRMNDVVEMTGLSKATIYRLIKSGDFPPIHKLGRRATGFAFSDIEHWVEERREASSV